MIINDDGTVSMIGTAEHYVAPGFEPMDEYDLPALFASMQAHNEQYRTELDSDYVANAALLVDLNAALALLGFVSGLTEEQLYEEAIGGFHYWDPEDMAPDGDEPPPYTDPLQDDDEPVEGPYEDADLAPLAPAVLDRAPTLGIADMYHLEV